MRTNLSLPQMVDLALGTPEVGAVNFNVLHTLLHALIQKLDLTESRAVINEEDREFLTKKQYEYEQSTDQATDDGAKSVTDSGIDGSTVSATLKSSATAINRSPYHQLEEKVSKLEQELELLNALPSNSELLDKMRYRGDGERIRPMSDMWQTMQITKKVDANEEGIGKLMSVIEDLMKEVTTVKDANEKLKSQVDEMNPTKQLKDLEDRMAKLEELMNALNDRVSGLDETVFVTWQGLEESLKGIRQELQPKERVVIEMANQTDPIPTPKPESLPPSRPVSAKPSRTSTPGPSQELQHLLEKLGHLTNKHDKLQTQVDDIEEELKRKANKEDLIGLGVGPSPEVPEDLLDQMKSMMNEIEQLKQARNKDSDALSRMQQVLLNLQAELERVNGACNQVMTDTENNTKSIDELFNLARTLEEVKADKDYVQSEVNVKADKRHLESKVNKNLFDSTTDELNRMISDLLQKLCGHEDEWKKLMGDLSSDMDGKLDRLEFGPIRQELERQLKALARQLKNMDFLRDSTEDDAAGIRKQLIQRYHCISCDRQIDMLPQGAIPAIPATPGLPPNRSTRPYTTYELDQIRQSAKNYNATQQVEVMDLYATSRACGGSHTTTYPHRRVTRATVLNNFFREDGSGAVPMVREELDIMGADGHIYRGRTDEQRLPDLPQTAPGMMSTTGRGSSPQRHPNDGQSNQVPAPHRPLTPRSARAATVQRVQSAGTSRRPGSAGAHIPSTEREEIESQSEAQPHTNTPIPPNVS